MLVKEPYWFFPARHQQQTAKEHIMTTRRPVTVERDKHTLKGRCDNLVAFFNSLGSLQLRDTATVAIDDKGQHPSLSRAISVLKSYARYPFTTNNSFSPHTYIEETIRLVTLFYIAVLWQDSLLSGDFADMDELNAALEAKEPYWSESIETLYNIALSGTGFPIIHPLKSIRVMHLMDVVRLLDLSSWVRVKVTLLEAFAGNPLGQLQGFRWDADLLYEELRYRY